MQVLPDLLAGRPSLVIVGSAVGECAAARGHYYAGRGDAFWRLLHESGLTSRLLAPEEDETLTEQGIGLTDVVKDVSAGKSGGLRFDVPTFLAKVAGLRPQWVAFNGKVAAAAVARALGEPRPGLGRQSWTVADAEVFVLPSSSGANQRRDYDGRATRLEWWAELATLSDLRHAGAPGR